MATSKPQRNPGSSRRESAPNALDRTVRRGVKKARKKAKSVMSDLWDMVKPDSMMSRRRRSR